MFLKSDGLLSSKDLCKHFFNGKKAILGLLRRFPARQLIYFLFKWAGNVKVFSIVYL